MISSHGSIAFIKHMSQWVSLLSSVDSVKNTVLSAVDNVHNVWMCMLSSVEEMQIKTIFWRQQHLHDFFNNFGAIKQNESEFEHNTFLVFYLGVFSIQRAMFCIKPH